MLINRRNMIQTVAGGLGAGLLAPSLLPGAATTTTPRRIIFFMQNQGFDPATCIP